MGEFQIGIAESDSDRAAAFRLRYEMYVEQQGLFRDVADHKNRVLREAGDDHATIWIARHDGAVVGTARQQWGGGGRFDREAVEAFDIEHFTDIVPERATAIGSRMMVREQFRGGPLAVMMIQRMFAYGIKRGTELIFGECEPHLVNTWTRLGFRPYGLCEHPINGTLVRLAFVLGDYEGVARLRSPLAPVLAEWTGLRDIAARLCERLSQGHSVIGESSARDQFWAEVERVLPRAKLARLLGGLTDEELDALVGSSYALVCDPGAVLIRKGHVSRTLYVLLTGSLVVRDEGVVIAEVDEPGAVLGEVAFFSGGERMSDVIVGAQGSRVLALSDRSLTELIRAQGAGAAKFLLSTTRGLCQKLRERANAPRASSV